MPERREVTEQIGWRAKQPLQVFFVCLGRSGVLRSLRRYLQAQSQGHYNIDRLEERGVEKGSARRSSLKGRERVIKGRDEHWLELFQRQQKGNFREAGRSAYGLFVNS